MNQEKQEQLYYFLCPLLNLNAPVYKTLIWAINFATKPKARLRRFANYLRKDCGFLNYTDPNNIWLRGSSGGQCDIEIRPLTDYYGKMRRGNSLRCTFFSGQQWNCELYWEAYDDSDCWERYPAEQRFVGWIRNDAQASKRKLDLDETSFFDLFYHYLLYLNENLLP